MTLAATALTTVATVEDELGISSGTETTRLERMIHAASVTAEQYAGRVFTRTTNISEKVAGQEGPFLFLARPPLNSITSISYLGSALSSGDYEIHSSNAGIVLNVNGSWYASGMYYGDISRTPVHGVERKSYTVVYDGGWYGPNQSGQTRALPYDIEHAVIMIVSYLRRNMGRAGNIASESLLGSSQSYTQPSIVGGSDWLDVMIPAAAAILKRYKLPELR